MNNVIDLSEIQKSTLKFVLPYNSNCYYCRIDSNIPVANLPPDRICIGHMAKMIAEVLFGNKDLIVVSGIHIKEDLRGGKNIASMLDLYRSSNEDEAVGEYVRESMKEYPDHYLFCKPMSLNVSQNIRTFLGVYPEIKK
jgi:hypothetical protein